MKKVLLCSTMLLLISVFLVANALADTPKKPVSPSFEDLGKSSPPSARSLLSAPREMLGATLNVPSILYPTIAAAVAAAGPDDQIVVAAGTYPISARIDIDHNLAITGAGSGSTTITTSFNTTNSGDTKGWFLVNAGCDFDLSGVTLDGAGQLVFQAIRNKGEGSANDVVFKNIKYNASGPDYAGTAIVAFGTGPVNVTNCVFSEIGRVGVLYYGSGVTGSSFTGNTYTGKGAGNWLDYGVEAGNGAVVTVDNCRISGCVGVATSDGSTSAGIIATTYFGPGTGATITHCDLTDNTGGIGVGIGGSDASTVVAHYNAIYGNDYGINSSNPTVDALNNWWGDATGPYNLTFNSDGLGNEVSDNVSFDPWLLGAFQVSVAPQQTLTNCETPKTVTFQMEQLGTSTDQVRGYEVKFSVNPAVATVSSFVQGTYLSSVGGTTQFYAKSKGGGVYTVTCAILGGSVGKTGGGDLFTVLLTPVVAGTSSIEMMNVKVRDVNNVPLVESAVGGSIQIDCTAPTMKDIFEAQNGWYNTAPVLSIFGFDDDVNLDLADYKIDDAASWTEIFSGINATEYNDDGWILPEYDDLDEGSHTVYFQVKDDAGNWNAGTISWQFYKDTVAPEPPTNFVAMPGHNKTHLTWTNPTDPNLVGVQIQFNAWLDYPEYATSMPAYPPDHTAGTDVTLATGTSFDDKPRAPRAIYYYSAFSKDRAGNYSSTIVGASDRTTSYWLGDVTSDGVVDIDDLVPFSGTFGLSESHLDFNSLCDFGPTDDRSRFGIPLPDNTIDFEDLMIFSMNWDNVTPAGVSARLASGKPVEELGDLVEFEIVPSNENEVSIVLKNRASTLKGIHLVVEISDGELVKVERGSVLGSVSPLFFGTIPSAAGDADICISALGVEVPLKASGEIARLVLKPSGDIAATVRIKSIDIRNLDNNKKEIVVTEEVEAPFVPKAAALMQNFPNPFNPSTTLAFDVAQAGNVTIQVYDVSGRLVVTLLNAHKEIGRHRVEWNGKNASGSLVPSGIYFYRMRAAGFEVTKKMILVR
jgi:hypothetical protein